MNRESRCLHMITAGLILFFSASLLHAQDWTKDDFLSNAFEKTESISVTDASKQITDAIFLDVRSKEELLAGGIPGAVHLRRGFLELKIHDLIPDKNKNIIIYCKGGNRSALAALTLMKMGYKNVYNLSGGYTDWVNAGFPCSQ